MALHDNPRKTSIPIHGNLKIACIVVVLVFANCCCFPFVNFNPDNPVDIGFIMPLLVIYLALHAHKIMGEWEATVFPKWSIVLIGVLNVALVLIGIGCRYMIEFGEVSNTYNFTVMNVAFQVLVLVSVSTAVCALGKKKPLRNDQGV